MGIARCAVSTVSAMCILVRLSPQLWLQGSDQHASVMLGHTSCNSSSCDRSRSRSRPVPPAGHATPNHASHAGPMLLSVTEAGCAGCPHCLWPQLGTGCCHPSQSQHACSASSLRLSAWSSQTLATPPSWRWGFSLLLLLVLCWGPSSFGTSSMLTEALCTRLNVDQAARASQHVHRVCCNVKATQPQGHRCWLMCLPSRLHVACHPSEQQRESGGLVQLDGMPVCRPASTWPTSWRSARPPTSQRRGPLLSSWAAEPHMSPTCAPWIQAAARVPHPLPQSSC